MWDTFPHTHLIWTEKQTCSVSSQNRTDVSPVSGRAWVLSIDDKPKVIPLHLETNAAPSQGKPNHNPFGTHSHSDEATWNKMPFPNNVDQTAVEFQVDRLYVGHYSIALARHFNRLQFIFCYSVKYITIFYTHLCNTKLSRQAIANA